ncbi:MAG: PQQ-dependent sugar dehydrogenase [Rubrivivax sp.]|jgi:glucose/arabinose dehydrogenase|nr:PQQ-dependent sugar dehydrogenase [Rubrivivax sp.]
MNKRPGLGWRAGLLACAGILGAWIGLAPAAHASEPKAVTVASGLSHPWGLAFLPDGRLLVTERPGRLRLVTPDGRLSAPLAGLPPIEVANQCGLLDVAVDPKFAENRRIWLTFAEPGEGGSGTALARARLEGSTLSEVQVVFRQQPKVRSGLHCGSRIVFDREGRILVGLGDRGTRRDDAQTLDTHIGKVVRLDSDGRAAAGNPFAGRPGALPEIFSLGHRNIQGAALHPQTGELWAVEHGPQGGDELNLVEAGRNYGWPVVTYGRNYGVGTRIGEEGPKAGYEQPVRHWVPTSVAPAGLAFVTGDRYKGWKGSLLMGTLREQVLIRMTLDGRRVASEERLLRGLSERIRDVREGPDGFIYLLTDSPDGRIVRLQP